MHPLLPRRFSILISLRFYFAFDLPLPLVIVYLSWLGHGLVSA